MDTSKKILQHIKSKYIYYLLFIVILGVGSFVMFKTMDIEGFATIPTKSISSTLPPNLQNLKDTFMKHKSEFSAATNLLTLHTNELKKEAADLKILHPANNLNLDEQLNLYNKLSSAGLLKGSGIAAPSKASALVAPLKAVASK